MNTAQPIDVRDMAIVHRTFDRMYDEAIGLVRAESSPTADRVTLLADFVDFGAMMLHHHHESEDELLYPLLLSRVPDQAATTEDVEHEHQLVRGALDKVSAGCAAWRGRPTQENRDVLATAIADLKSVLQTHAKDEEDKVVPLAAVMLTQQEWDTIGDRAVASIPNKWKPIAFGFLLEPLDDSDRSFMKSKLPAPVRLLFPVMMERPYKKYAAKLRAGA